METSPFLPPRLQAIRARHFAPPAQDLPGLVPVTSARVHLATGIDLHYVAKGPMQPRSPGAAPTDQAMILIPGYSDSWRSFEEMLALLPVPEYDVPVFALDMRGHGASSASDAYTQGDFAADVAAFMEALDIRKALLVGHSMGGHVAHTVAVAYPDRVAGLVLIDTAATIAGQPVIAELRAATETFGDAEPAPTAFIEDFQASTFYRPPAPYVLHRYVSESLRLSGATWKKTLDGMDQEDHREQLPGVAAPALILWGERDTIFEREAQDELMTLLPRATLVTYPDAGHAVNVEKAEAVVADVQTFVRQHASALRGTAQ